MAVVNEVETNSASYEPFFADDNIHAWIARMRLDRQWGDNHSLKAAVEVLHRPALVWRLGAPSTEPATPLLPTAWRQLERVKPLYVVLDERRRGCEHYDALLLHRPAPAQAGPSRPAPLPPPPWSPEQEMMPATSLPAEPAAVPVELVKVEKAEVQETPNNKRLRMKTPPPLEGWPKRENMKHETQQNKRLRVKTPPPTQGWDPLPPPTVQKEKPKTHAAKVTSARSDFGPWSKYNLTCEELWIIVHLIEESIRDSWDLTAIIPKIHMQVPEFEAKRSGSTTKHIPRRTLQRWRQDKCSTIRTALLKHARADAMAGEGHTRREITAANQLYHNTAALLMKKHTAAGAQQAWRDEQRRNFSIISSTAANTKDAHCTSAQSGDASQSWLQIASWTFCLSCGRRKPSTEVHLQFQKKSDKAVCQACKPCCDDDAWTMQ
eukprot:921494-Amphidinium_carterae.1